MPEFEPATDDYAERARASFAKQGMMAHMGAELSDLRPGFCEIKLPVRDELTQQHGFVHAGAVAAIADSAGGYAAFTLFEAEASVLTVEFKLNLTAPAVGDFLIARGEVLKPGRVITVCRCEVVAVRDGTEKTCAIMQQTMMRIIGRADIQE